MILHRVGVLSLAKIMGVAYAALGALAGLFVAAASLVEAAFGRSGNSFPGVGLGVFAILFFPALYGALGFVGGLLAAFVYNLTAAAIGGVELEFADAPSKSQLGR